MQNGYYLNETSKIGNSITAPGVENKIVQQIEVLNRYFNMSHLEIIQMPGQYIRKRLPLYSGTYVLKGILESIDSAKFLYVRKCRLERGLFLFFRAFKRKFPNSIIILELPTYPYDQIFQEEHGGMLVQFPFYAKDVFYRRRIKGIIDRIVIYDHIPEIFGIKTISTVNGIQVDRFTRKKKREDDGSIVLLTVSNFQPGHGYERLIEGLNEYYQTSIYVYRRLVRVIFVGEGEEKNKYEKLVKMYSLESVVEFPGKKTKDELDDYYNNADIGLGCFGQYKYGFEGSSALKIREYLARGIPVISGCREDVLAGKNQAFYLEFPNDASPVDITQIIEFWDRLKSNGNLSKEIYEYAKDTVDMELTLKPVVDYINSQN